MAATDVHNVWENSDYVAVTEQVDSLFRRVSQRDENTLLTYHDDELVLEEIAVLLRKLDQFARPADITVSVALWSSARRFEDRLFELENLVAYSQAIYVAAQVQPLMQSYADYVVARDLASVSSVNAPDPMREEPVVDARFFLKYIMDATPSMNGYNLRLFGIHSVGRLVAIIDDITQGRYAGDVRGVLRIRSARRIAQHIEKMHAIYAERFRIGPANITTTPRTGAARVLFASWQDLNQMNGLFPKDAIIERALQNAPVGEEIVAHHAEFVAALEYCAEDMRSVMSTAWIVAQRTAYMRLTREQRETCAEIGRELRGLANDVRDIVYSRSGRIFYHGMLREKYHQLLFVDLKIAIERYSCEFV